MKGTLVAICVLASCASTSVWAQDCKPNVTREDRISKERIDVWVQELFATGFGASLMSTSEVGITATVGRYGSLNAINLQIQKKEESATNAAFEMAFRAAKGSPIYLGFKTGEPVALVVTDVSNAANVQQGLFSAKGVTTVVLSAVVSDQDLASVREALTSRQINAVRISLAGGQQIEKSVNDKNGKKMMEKFTCFYQALDKRGIDLSALAKATVQASEIVAGGESKDYAPTAPGKYLFKKGKGKAGDYTELGSDGKFYIEEGGRGFAGTYTVRGDVVTFVLPNGQAMRGKLAGNTMVAPDGTVLEKADVPKPSSAQLTIDQIIQMVGAKIPDDIIIASIEKSVSKFDLTPENLIRLKAAGVSDPVLRAMAK